MRDKILDFDVVVIGSGPGGYTAAVRASQLGGKVAMVEKGELGGVCLNEGCIPAKTLIATADLFGKIRKAGELGISVDNARIDYPAVIDRKERVMKRLRAGIAALFRSHGITLIKGSASFASRDRLIIDGDPASEIRFKSCVAAAGSKPLSPPGIVTDGRTVVTTSELLNMRRIPSSLLIVGGGVIGMEFASLFNLLGAKVTVVEVLPRILANMDEEISAMALGTMRKRGVEILTGSKITGIQGNAAEVAKPEGSERIEAEIIVVCAGRAPNLGGLGLENAGIGVDGGMVKVNGKMQTTTDGIYAVGDLTGKHYLAYTASAQGIAAAENAMGIESAVDYRVIPSCVFTSPEIGVAGLTEAGAKAQGRPVRVGRFPFAANGRAVILGETEGMVKVVTDEETGRILGVHMMGPESAEMIHTAVMAMKMGATAGEFQRILFGHPTLSEAMLGSVDDARKGAVDLPKRS